jgi:siroheme synthase
VLAGVVSVGFPLTHPELSRSFVVTTGHSLEELDWALLQAAETIVLLMGGRTLPAIAVQLVEDGKPATTPVTVVREAGCPEQQIWRGTLDSIGADTEGVQLSPSIIIIGKIAGQGYAGLHGVTGSV